MSSIVSDILICLLLIAGVGFGAISLMGLLIFPDIRSRMYTALRAGFICILATAGAAAVYAFTLLLETGGSQYSTFLFHAILLTGIVIVGIMIVSRQIREKTNGYSCSNVSGPAKSQEKG